MAAVDLVDFEDEEGFWFDDRILGPDIETLGVLWRFSDVDGTRYFMVAVDLVDFEGEEDF
jgi:hypothetical protein